jgi:hypothetical protein
MNPGYDLLLTANWSSISDYRSELMSESPALTGLSQFAAGATNHLKAQAGRPDASMAVAGEAAPAQGHLLRNLAAMLGAGIVLLAAATLLLRARGARRL